MVGVTTGFTVMGMLFETTTAGEAQAALLVIEQDTWFPSCRMALEKVRLLVPVATPPICQVYTGVVPPLVGDAVNVTCVPEQMVVAVDVMVMAGVTMALI